MWHKPCRTFHPWCLCIKTRCLSLFFFHIRPHQLPSNLYNISHTFVSNKITQMYLEHRLLDLTHGFNGLRKNNCKPRRETFKYFDSVRLILDVSQYWHCWLSTLTGCYRCEFSTLWHFIKGGYYSRNLTDGLRAIVLNTNLNTKKDKATSGMADPGGQFAWAQDQFEAAKDAQQNVGVTLFR